MSQDLVAFRHFCTFTYIYIHICDAGDFICLAGEREKECLGGRLPLNGRVDSPEQMFGFHDQLQKQH